MQQERDAKVKSNDVLQSHLNDAEEIIQRLMKKRDALQEQVKLLRSTLQDFRDNWDCDSNAHKYGSLCRCCAAKEALAATEPKGE